MKVVGLRINGIKNPMGFSYNNIICSWKVEEFSAKEQKRVNIDVSLNEDFSSIIYYKEGEELKSQGEPLEIKLNPRTTYYYRITVTDVNDHMATSETAYFETGKMNEEWAADWIGMQGEDEFHPIFFTDFYSEKLVKRARLYVCGLGLYEAYLNGIKIGEDYLAPFLNDYDTELQYQTYDITAELKNSNRIELSLGNGWYKGRFGFKGEVANYGDCFMAIAEIHMEYEDGTTEIVKTDEHWKYIGSVIEASDIYDGEIVNHTLWENKDNSPKVVKVLKTDKNKLVERYSLPVKVKEELAVKELLNSPAGETILDMGQNFAGYLEFMAELPKGTKIVLDFGEVLQNGNFYNENYRTAKSQFVYISSGTRELARPHFTFFGFRYVRVTGWIGQLNPNDFKGKVVYSDLERTGIIETSNDKINRLIENCLWGQKSNFIDVPTDCPQRDERLGWTGDAQVFAPTACYNMDTRAFYHKFIRDLRNEQVKINGSIPNYIPNLEHSPGGSSVWGDVATFLPTTLYEHYADKESLAYAYPMMKDWVDYITREDERNGKHNLFDFGFHFGDWLALDGVTPQSFKGGTDDYFIASCYYYASVSMVADAAQLLDKKEEEVEYRNLAVTIKKSIFAEYFTPNGRLSIDTQTAYLIALKFGIYMDKDKLMQGFTRRLEKDCYKIKGGFVGAPMICNVLGENGMEDLAYHILFQEEFPSWLYCVNLGATTIWERWNSLLSDGSISGTGMNSLNHYAYGSVIEFIYRQVAGIKPIEPGFSKVCFEPKLNRKFSYVNCSYNSVSGNYVSNWRINEDGTVSMHFEVPFHCKAVVKLPYYEQGELALDAGRHDITYMPTKDYRLIFSMDSRLEELAKNEEAMKILGEKLPIAAGMIAEGNIENLSLSLGKLLYMGFMGFRQEDVLAAAEEILKIKQC